ncbi:type VI secretion system Vgr family protein [Aggregatibacter actinomycetemcomitans]|uniref:type VI secretion system Vgr family protein n=1 Tax=Aggregatibacter actinomycetemcomitans TaxID=714 RepID=UPI0021CCEA45|nr:type VI secretion system tip protein TssI/VgrG [Aggregatibacter actinomycetemcomitans]
MKLQFPWDREGRFDEHSSCWVRVVQDWAGAQYGNLMIPRIGDEVLVKFLNGDPDRPIVTGRAYHSTTEPPYPLPEHKTRMTIKSKSHKGNGFNELRFEDEKDLEEIFLHAEKDLNHIVKHNETGQIGHNRTEQVSRDETIHIGNNRTETVSLDEDLTVKRDQTRNIGRNRITKIEQDEVLNINNRYVNVHGDTIIHVGKELNIEIAQNGSWHAGELFEQICEQFELEGYKQVELSGPGGSIILNREGITLVGDVYIEGELVMEEEEVEGVSLFDTSINETLTPTTYYSTRLDVYDIYGRCNEKKIPYTILDSQGEVVTGGILDEDGRTARVYRETEDKLKVLVGHAQVLDWL